MRFVRADPDGDAEPLAPCAFGQRAHLPLAAPEFMLAVERVEHEPLEVPEPIEQEATDLAGVAEHRPSVFARRVFAGSVTSVWQVYSARPTGLAQASRRGLHQSPIAAEPRHAASDAGMRRSTGS